MTGEVYYSERWWNMLGYASGEGIDDSGAWRRLLHPDDDAMISDYLEDLLPSRREGYTLEFRLRHRDGHYVPVLSRGFILRDGAGTALRISGVNTDLTERKRTERHIYELAYFDHLTGLPNRRFLIEELEHVLARCRRSRHCSALLYLDLDNFKLLNDTMGHDSGDMLLSQAAQRLRSTVRDSDQLARLGGDEFVVVLESLGHSSSSAAAEAGRVVTKILATLCQPYQLGSLLFKSSASIGITLFDGRGSNIEALLKQADLAMYRAKAAGRNQGLWCRCWVYRHSRRKRGWHVFVGIDLHRQAVNVRQDVIENMVSGRIREAGRLHECLPLCLHRCPHHRHRAAARVAGHQLTVAMLFPLVPFALRQGIWVMARLVTQEWFAEPGIAELGFK